MVLTPADVWAPGASRSKLLSELETALLRPVYLGFGLGPGFLEAETAES